MTGGQYVVAEEKKERFGSARGCVEHIPVPQEADEPGIEARRPRRALFAVPRLIRERRAGQNSSSCCGPASRLLHPACRTASGQ